MGLLQKARILIERLSFRKQRADGIELADAVLRGLRGFLVTLMEVVDHGLIEKAQDQVVAIAVPEPQIRWNGPAPLVLQLDER